MSSSSRCRRTTGYPPGGLQLTACPCERQAAASNTSSVLKAEVANSGRSAAPLMTNGCGCCDCGDISRPPHGAASERVTVGQRTCSNVVTRLFDLLTYLWLWLTYGGRLCNSNEANWSASELELAGIIYAIESNSQYFIGRKFRIITDHISSTFIRNLKFSQGKLYRWSLRLQAYLFEISHLPGAKMPAVVQWRSPMRRHQIWMMTVLFSFCICLWPTADVLSYVPPSCSHGRRGRRQMTIITLQLSTT